LRDFVLIKTNHQLRYLSSLIWQNILIVIFASSINLSGQVGELFITDFVPYSIYSGDVWNIEQGEYGHMFFSTRKGVISFDSEQWSYISTASFPYALEFDTSLNRMYVGCSNLLGYLAKNQIGEYYFEKLHEPKDDIGVIYDIILDSNVVYCFSSYAISKISLVDTSLNREWISTSKDNFLGAFKFQDNIYVNIADAGLFLLENDTIWPTVNGYKLTGTEIVFSVKLSDKKLLLGTSDNELLFFNGTDFQPFNHRNEEYLAASVISDGRLINDSVLAVSTLIGGCIIIDVNSGNTLHTINYQTGLPDDEIITMGTDRQNGLWLSHTKGLSRVDQNFPVRNFAVYPGLEGNILHLVTPDEGLYVATSEGVYFLNEVKDYSERILLKQAEKDQIDVVSKKKQKKGRSSFFGFFKKDKEEQQVKDADLQTSKRKRFKIFGRSKDLKKEVLVAEDDEDFQYIKEKIYELRSVSHKFSKVKGINDKCKQIITLPDRMIVAANNGLYQIKNNKASIIVSGVYFYGLGADSSNTTIVAITPDELYVLSFIDNRWVIERHDAPDEFVRSIYVVSNNTFWLGGYDIVIEARRKAFEQEFEYISHHINSQFLDLVEIQMINDELYFFQASKQYVLKKDSLIQMSVFMLNSAESRGDVISDRKYIWIKNTENWVSFPPDEELEKPKIFLNLFPSIRYIHADNQKNIWLVTENNNIYRIIHPDSMQFRFSDPEIFITRVTNADGDNIDKNNCVVSYNENALEFIVSAPGYLKQNSTQYSYYVEGLMENWTRWRNEQEISLPYIPAGDFTLHVKARNILGVVSREQRFNFTVKKPFWQTGFFYFSLVALIATGMWWLLKNRERGLLHEKTILSEKVIESNAELEKQKEEIEIKNAEITNSLHYAKKIQTAIFPSKENLDELLEDYFVFFKPQDITSGDLYWGAKFKNKIVVAAINCKGHGVSGAFIRMLGISFLNEIVNKEEKLKAAEILDQMQAYVNSTLSQKGNSHEEQNDIELALCLFDFSKKTMEFSGAYNPVILIRNNQIYEYKSNRKPEGIFAEQMQSFTNHIINLMPNDKLYLFTDCYADQIGEPDNKKQMVGKFKKILLGIHQEYMSKQGEILNEELGEWMELDPQIDDVLVIGVGI
jgi:serine phosphatase RsbU (regulator of sigma subunit)